MKCRGVSPRILRSFPANIRGENPLRNKWFLFFSANFFFFFFFFFVCVCVCARGIPRRNAKKSFFSWADLYALLGIQKIRYHWG